jgi:signal peptidase II
LKRSLPLFAILAGVVALDQATKWWIRRSMELHEFRPLIEGLLSLSHIRNRGAAFGILQDADLPHQSAIFSAVSLLALGAIAFYAVRLPAEAKLPRLALSLVLGGAVGNLIDRVRFGYVVDFIHVYWKHHQWPDFNAADSAITVGVTLLLLDMLRAPEGGPAPGASITGTPTPAGRTD